MGGRLRAPTTEGTPRPPSAPSHPPGRGSAAAGSGRFWGGDQAWIIGVRVWTGVGRPSPRRMRHRAGRQVAPGSLTAALAGMVPVRPAGGAGAAYSCECTTPWPTGIAGVAAFGRARLRPEEPPAKPGRGSPATTAKSLMVAPHLAGHPRFLTMTYPRASPRGPDRLSCAAGPGHRVQRAGSDGRAGTAPGTRVSEYWLRR